MSDHTTWRKEISTEMKDHGETWDDVESLVFSKIDGFVGDPLDREFYAGFGGTEGHKFTVWTSGRVYFPTEYDGAEGCSSVARHPDGVPTEHV